MKTKKERNIYYEEDTDLSVLDGKTIGMIGYGHQGRIQALNMRDSGIKDIIAGNIKDESWEKAEEDGFDIFPIAEAAEKSDIMFLLIPDEVAPRVYDSEIEPQLQENDMLIFAHGFNITYGLIAPPKYVDVALVAPMSIGNIQRDLFKDGSGFPSFLAIEQDFSGKTKEKALAVGKGIGSASAGLVETTFETEAKMDMLLEQGVNPILFNTLMAKFEVEVENGILPDESLLELYLSKELSYIAELFAAKGAVEWLEDVSNTCKYGVLSRMNEIYEGKNDHLTYENIKNFIRKQYEGIDNGQFTAEFFAEGAAGHPVIKRLKKKFDETEFIQAEQEVKNRLKKEIPRGSLETLEKDLEKLE